MPIANCIVTPSCTERSGEIVVLWSHASGISSEHMTVNIVTSIEQYGGGYAVMATLLLPSVWSAAKVSSLQMGLATALSQYFIVPLDEVHVVTHIIPSGRVVESGREIAW